VCVLIDELVRTYVFVQATSFPTEVKDLMVRLKTGGREGGREEALFVGYYSKYPLGIVK